jgi:hypothetical protein
MRLPILSLLPGRALLLICLPAILVQSHAIHARWQQSCQDWATFKAQRIELNNNTWGKQDIKDYEQCIYQNLNNPLHMGWRWKWPQHQSGVKAYPSLMYGYKPWNRHSTTRTLPLQLKQLDSLKVSFSAEMKYQGAVNLLLEAWLTDSATPEPYDRTSEIAIHLMQHQWPGQGGDYYESVTIGNRTYAVYINHQMKVPGDSHTWSYLSFVNTGKPIYKGEINLKEFVDYLLEKKMIIDSEYLTSVELGNEIDYGEGESNIRYFHVRVNTSAPS